MTDAIQASVQASDAEPDSPDRARRLFRYLNGDEWTDYRAIIAVLASFMSART